MRLGTIVSVLCLTAVSSCGDPTGPAAAVAGRYDLQSVDARALPTELPCGLFDVAAATLNLTPNGFATITRRYTTRSSGAVITYSGSGLFQVTSDAVNVQVDGRWSHLPDGGGEHLRFERHGAELRLRGVGSECDAQSTETYVRAGQ